MPINILSLPLKDLRYALRCMGICDFIAFSLCSKRTKNLARISNRKIEPIDVVFNENRIWFHISARIFQELQDDPDQRNYERITFRVFDSCIYFGNIFESKVWRKQGYTRSDWLSHFLSIFDGSVIGSVAINDFSLLGTIKKIIPRCQNLDIRGNCSREITKTDFLKLAPISDGVQVDNNPFDNEINISELLTLNLNTARFLDFQNPFKLELDSLLVLNVIHLTITVTSFTKKELNRFLKIWIKRNHAHYRPKYIRMYRGNKVEIHCEDVLKEIKHEAVKINDYSIRLKRRDGKELLIMMDSNLLIFQFQ